MDARQLRDLQAELVDHPDQLAPSATGGGLRTEQQELEALRSNLRDAFGAETAEVPSIGADCALELSLLCLLINGRARQVMVDDLNAFVAEEAEEAARAEEQWERHLSSHVAATMKAQETKEEGDEEEALVGGPSSAAVEIDEAAVAATATRGLFSRDAIARRRSVFQAAPSELIPLPHGDCWQPSGDTQAQPRGAGVCVKALPPRGASASGRAGEAHSRRGRVRLPYACRRGDQDRRGKDQNLCAATMGQLD